MRSGYREGCQKCLRPTLPHTSSHLFRQGMHLHKHRLDGAGRPVGKAEYVTPQSQHVMEDGMGGAMMNVNIPEAMKVCVDGGIGGKRQTYADREMMNVNILEAMKADVVWCVNSTGAMLHVHTTEACRLSPGRVLHPHPTSSASLLSQPTLPFPPPPST